MTQLWARVWHQFWALPLACAVAAGGLGLALCAADATLQTSLSLPFLFAGGPEGARSLLSAIITSMISFTGLVFSITIVVLQLTSSQFSPRVLRTFLDDRFNQLTLGVFVATFVYALVVLRGVRGTAETEPVVPQLAVTLAFGLVLASVVIFLSYIHHIAQSIRVATIITHIWTETVQLLDERHPADRSQQPSSISRPGSAHRVPARQAGVLQRIQDDTLQELAEKHTVTICVLRSVGEFVPHGAPLLDVYGEHVPDTDELHAAFLVGKERSMDEDVGFGLRQLVDIANRALSPGINDPTTAIQVIDHLHDLLRRLATRRLLPRQRLSDNGLVCVDVPQPDFTSYLDLALNEIGFWGKDDDRIQRRLHVMLQDLREAARPENQSVLTERLARSGQDRPPVRSGGFPPPSDVGLR